MIVPCNLPKRCDTCWSTGIYNTWLIWKGLKPRLRQSAHP